jgi:hypothetical protein
LISFALLAAACAKLDAGFVCSKDPQCLLDGVQGKCEVTNWCSVPDPLCASQRRYRYASMLDGVCVDGAAPDSDLVGHWPLDQTTGTTAPDVSGNGYDGVLHNNAGSWATDGKYAGALSISAGGWLEMPSLAGTAFPVSGTISFWVKSPFDEQVGLFDDFETNRNHLFVRLRVPQMIQFAAESVLILTDYAAGGWEFPPVDDQWNHVVMVWDTGPAQRFSIYLNGQTMSQTIVEAGWKPSQQQMMFGHGVTHGELDEIWLYKRAMSTAEVMTLP